MPRRGAGMGKARRNPVNYGSVPAQVTNLVATPGDTTVGLAWDAIGGATSYQVLRSTTTGTEVYLATVSGAHAYTDNDVVNGTAYYYKVKAVNAAGPGLPSSEANATPS
jgi:fibronectin type 3 domain-containing protein